MPLTSSIIIGFVRVCLLLLFLYYINRKFVSKSSSNFLEFLVHHWFRYGSILGLVLFFSIQLGIYDLLNVIVIMSFIALMDFIGIDNIKNFPDYFNRFADKSIRTLIKRVELKKPLTKWLDYKNKARTQRGRYLIFGTIAAVALLIFASRYYFFRFDQYSLTGMWLNDLQKVIDFDSQIWFLNEVMVSGNLAFANFYGKIAAVSPEVALQSAGIIESVLLGVVIFWVIRKITYSDLLASVVASLSFALALSLTPVNIHFLVQNRPVFLAMSFGFPVMVFLLKPGALKFKRHNYFVSMLCAVICIGFIDLFTLFILFPPFVVIAAIFTKSKSRNYYWLGLLAYLIGCLSVFLIYNLICSYFETDFWMFLHANLLSVSSYTYIPQLVLPISDLILYYQYASWAVAAIILKFIFINKEKWSASLAFLAYFNVLALMGNLRSSWIDTDLLSQAMTVFLPIVAGIAVAAVIRIFKFAGERLVKLNVAMVIVVFCGSVLAAYHFQQPSLEKLAQSNTRPRQVLDAYDEITRSYFPYSYAVVNDNFTQVISTNKHFFMNYSDFLYEYPRQDSIYFSNIKNPKFFKKNPQHVIPKSVLLFVFKEQSQSGESEDISGLLLDQVAMLKKRGRKVEVFYQNKNLKVYEIVNEPGQSRISDLIF